MFVRQLYDIHILQRKKHVYQFSLKYLLLRKTRSCWNRRTNLYSPVNADFEYIVNGVLKCVANLKPKLICPLQGYNYNNVCIYTLWGLPGPLWLLHTQIRMFIFTKYSKFTYKPFKCSKCMQNLSLLVNMTLRRV